VKVGDCVYFNGIGLGGQNKRCKAGVAYRELVSGSHFGWATRLPCLPSTSKGAPECAFFRAMTKDENDKRESLIRDAIDKALSSIAAGNCHICGSSIEPSRTVMRCKYASCGHRIGQVAK
jgi:hypothetical protein